MVLALRVLVAEHVISPDRVELIYAEYDPNRETIIELDSDGRMIRHIPAGFGDWTIRMLMRLG
jgi:hypothetical protein